MFGFDLKTTRLFYKVSLIDQVQSQLDFPVKLSLPLRLGGTGAYIITGFRARGGLAGKKFSSRGGVSRGGGPGKFLLGGGGGSFIYHSKCVLW